jgi:hypothetical protein
MFVPVFAPDFITGEHCMPVPAQVDAGNGMKSGNDLHLRCKKPANLQAFSLALFKQLKPQWRKPASAPICEVPAPERPHLPAIALNSFCLIDISPLRA